MENDIKTIPIRITVEKTIRFQRCLDVTPKQMEMWIILILNMCHMEIMK